MKALFKIKLDIINQCVDGASFKGFFEDIPVSLLDESVLGMYYTIECALGNSQKVPMGLPPIKAGLNVRYITDMFGSYADGIISSINGETVEVDGQFIKNTLILSVWED